MHRKTIDVAQLTLQAHALFHTQWMLLTSGDFAAGHYNAMTIGWGALGTMWSKPFAYVAVRHSRFTYEFMEKYATFTLTAFPHDYHAALSLLGTRSGRDDDKIAASGLTPEAANVVAAPSFKEAELAIECRKMYANDLNPDLFLDEAITKHYPHKDYHRVYYGEVVSVAATESYFS